jgi:uncharacterized protein (UPF0276 family)
MIGIGHRRELARWIASRPPGLECLEITAEHFFEDAEPLRDLRRTYPLLVHGLGLSLGTPGPLEPDRLRRFARVCEAAAPRWISEHVAFTRSEETDLGHLNPVRPTRDTVQIIADHARELADRCQRSVVLENITSHVRLTGELTEPEFLNELCARAECGLLLDVTNLFINSRNHGFDPFEWLAELEPGRIRQLHMVGYSVEGARWTDHHAEPIQPELIELARVACAPGGVEAIILERDVAFPGAAELAVELGKLKSICERS